MWATTPSSASLSWKASWLSRNASTSWRISWPAHGREMTVNVTGHCKKLSIDGVINKITIDSVDTIDMDGIHNVVTYHSGSPKITKQNGQNTVQQG